MTIAKKIIIINEQQFRKLVENKTDELSSDLLSNATQRAYGDDNRVRKFRYGTVDALSKENPTHVGYPIESNKDDEFLRLSNDKFIHFNNSEYNSLEDLYNGVKQGKLLIHCRKMQGNETLETIYPEIGETVSKFYGEYANEDEYGEGLLKELVFASDDFNWVKNARNAVYFVYSDNFLRSLGDGRVMTPSREIYYNENVSVSIEPGDWFSEEPVEVAAVLFADKKLSENKEYLQEHKSVSQDVLNITKYIINQIVNDSVKCKTYYSERNRQPFKENEIQCDLTIFGLETITVYYLIYFYDKDGKQVDTFNCSYDEKTKRMEIITYVKGNVFADDFEESVTHEVTHMFQYGKGMKKRETFYDKCIELYNNENEDISKLGLILYHSFPHEQDAFAHQFFQRLIDLNMTVTHKTDYNGLITRYSRYGLLCKYKKEVLASLNKHQVAKAIEELGSDKILIKKRILYSFNRFRKKLLNVCDEYFIHTRKLAIETVIKKRLLEDKILIENGYNIGDRDKLFKLEKILKY